MLKMKAVREDMGLTQKQLAKAAGISQQHISLIEKNHVIPGEKWKQKISEALNFPDIITLFSQV